MVDFYAPVFSQLPNNDLYDLRCKIKSMTSVISRSPQQISAKLPMLLLIFATTAELSCLNPHMMLPIIVTANPENTIKQ